MLSLGGMDVVDREGVGRCVLARSALCIGTTVLDGERPLVHAVTDSAAASCCHHSLEPLAENSVVSATGLHGGVAWFASSAAHSDFISEHGPLILGADQSPAPRVESTPLRILLSAVALANGSRNQLSRFERIRTLRSNRESFAKATIAANFELVAGAAEMIAAAAAFPDAQSESTRQHMLRPELPAEDEPDAVGTERVVLDAAELVDLLLAIRSNGHAIGDADMPLRAVLGGCCPSLRGLSPRPRRLVYVVRQDDRKVAT